MVATRTVAAAAVVSSCQPPQFGDDVLRARRQHPIAADQIRVVVDKPRRSARETARGMEIEEHRTAAEERFDVAGKPERVIAAERGEELPFAARPFQQRTSSHGRRHARLHDIIIGVLAADT